MNPQQGATAHSTACGQLTPALTPHERRFLLCRQLSDRDSTAEHRHHSRTAGFLMDILWHGISDAGGGSGLFDSGSTCGLALVFLCRPRPKLPAEL
ncbi:hypothetical protein [Kamptonema formosum]|uniref:hypothetical protein n=1 Tax=Kamptonema formosum TaxID=331992 RepID=UPI00036EC65E|nr:hypothetical protein [Oscillatoria sp. PCC 10802]